MGTHICEKCKKIHRTKELLQKHLEKCNMSSLKQYEYLCDMCSKTFSSFSNLNYHIKSQHYSVKLIDNRDDPMKNICKNAINNIINNINKSINTTNNSIIQNITNNNDIKIQPLLFVKHGDERIDHITKELLLKILSYENAQKMFVDLMTVLYFTREVPENNNWILAYPCNDKAGVVYNDDTNKFERTSTEQIINSKFSNMIDKIVPLIDEIYADKDSLTRRQYINILHFYDKECIYDLSNHYPDLYELIHKLAYEQRTVPMSTWKEQGLDAKHLSLKF